MKKKTKQSMPVSGKPLIIILCLLVMTFALELRAESYQNWPQRPIKVIVPFSADGGSDTFARQLVRVIRKQQLLEQPLVVINVGGGGGTIGSRRVKNARPDGYTMLMLHEGLLTAKHAGKAVYGAEAFESVAATGKTDIVLAVKNTSDHTELKDLMNLAAKEPNTLNFAANLGAPSHFIGLILEKSAEGAMFNFVQYGGGAERYGALMGGHVDLSIFTVEEYLRYKEGGLKALAVFSHERHADLPQLQTALEQGYEVQTTNMHFWWMPKGTPGIIQDKMASAIEAAMQSSEMQQFMKVSKISPLSLKGADLDNELLDREDLINKVSMRKVDVLPHFELWIFAIVIILTFVAFDRGALAQAKEKKISPMWNALSIEVFSLTLIYVLVLALSTLSYPLVTALYLFVLAWVISENRKAPLLKLGVYSMSVSFLLFFLFTKVLIVDLPG